MKNKNGDRSQEEVTIGDLWNYLKGTNKLKLIKENELRKFANEKGISLDSFKELKLHFNPNVKGMMLEFGKYKSVFPREDIERSEIFQKNKEPLQIIEQFWEKVDWFIPPFIARGHIDSILKKHGVIVVNQSSYEKNDLQLRFDRCLPELYNFNNFIPNIEQNLIKSKYLKEHIPLIREAIHAFYSGMNIVSFTALIPVVEKFFRSLLANEDCENNIQRVEKCIERAQERSILMDLHHADWFPDIFKDKNVCKVISERYLMLETMKNWLINSFFDGHNNYNNFSGFNRNIYAHFNSEVWQNRNNFFRSIGLIQALSFIECFADPESNVSLIPPEPNEVSMSLVKEIEVCIILQFTKDKILSDYQLGKNLPFNITSSQDGWLTRAAILSDKMNNELIPRMREKNWDCYEITDPQRKGEFITVKAKNGGKTLKVALLFSCATSNEVYKELDKEYQYILYVGSQYHQPSYTQGVKAEIRPLNAWIPPDP